MTALKIKKLPYAWKHSRLSYHEPKEKKVALILHNAIEFVFFENNTDFAYAAIYIDHVVFSFRGTDNIKGWISNFGVYPLKNDEYLKSVLRDGKWGKGMIHNEFYDSWAFFKSCVDKIIETYHINPEETPITTCGHSRGGVLAELCSRHLAKNRGIKSSCFTFGAPAAGTKKYRDQFRSLPINGTRVINGWDIVPTLPPRSLGFRPGCANRVWVKKAFWKKWLPWIKISDHYQDSYENLIQRKFMK